MILLSLVSAITIAAVTFTVASSDAEAGLLGSLLRAGGAAAAGKGKKVYDANTLQPQGLKMCLISAHQLDADQATLETKKKKIDSDRALLNGHFDRIKRDSVKEMTDKQLVDAHNARVKAYRTEQASFNKQIADFNLLVDKSAAQNTAFKHDCAAKKYFSSDLADIRSQLSFDIAAYTK